MSEPSLSYLSNAVELIGVEDVACLQLLVALDHGKNFKLMKNIFQRKKVKPSLPSPCNTLLSSKLSKAKQIIPI